MQETNSLSIFSKKKQKTQIIRLESDSEDIPTVGKNKNSISKEKILEDSPNQIQEIINLEENIDNLKSNSQSSISTSTSHGNLVLNGVNNSAKIENKNSSMFSISKRTKGILERVIENNKKAKLLEKMAKEKENNLDKNRFIGKKIRNNDSNSLEPKAKEKKLKLSKKTKEVLKKLQDIRNNRFDDINNKEQNNQIRKSSFSNLHIKYELLLQPSRELRLPISYKKLLDNFISLDRTLNKKKLSSNKNFNYFSNIKNIIESYTHKNFTIDTLKNILYVVPHFYILKYVKTENNGLDKKNDLMIDFPNDFNERINKNYPKNFNFLDINFFKEGINYQPLLRNLTENELSKRKNIFINILNQIVNDFHNKFLKEKNIKIKFNPLIQKTWHHDFNPDTMCEAIPKFEIPDPPENKSIFEQTINNNDIKKQINLINNQKKNDIIKNDKNKKPSGNKFISEELLKKIRAKEQENKIINEINNYNYYHNLQNDKNKVIKYLLLQIKTLLMTHNKSMELNELSELILDSNIMFKDFFENKQNLNQEIIKLCQNNSDFIKINKHSTLGLIVVLENNGYLIPDELTCIKS
jgi:hypothetical protein